MSLPRILSSLTMLLALAGCGGGPLVDAQVDPQVDPTVSDNGSGNTVSVDPAISVLGLGGA